MLTLRPVTRVVDAPAKAGLKKTGWFAGVKAGLLPPPFRLSERCCVVYDDEIAAVVAARAAGRSDEQVRALVAQLVAARQEEVAA